MKVFAAVAFAWVLVLFPAGAQQQKRIKAPDTVQGALAGAVKSVKVFSQDGDGEKVLKTEQTFNRAGDWLEIKQYQEGKVVFLTRYQYDPVSGAMASYERLDGQNSVILAATCSFDGAQKKMICAFKNAEGKDIGKEEVSYDAKGLETASQQTDADGKFVNSSLVKREPSGRPGHLNFSVPGHDNYMEFDYRWDPKGFELSKVENTDGKKTTREFSEVKLDPSGNWIERTVKATGEGGDTGVSAAGENKTTKETRVIEYFEK